MLGLDGSYNQDATALIACTVEPTPHIFVVGIWEPKTPEGVAFLRSTDDRIPIGDVEQAIRDACRRWRVLEVVCDPYRWQRSMEALAAEGLPMIEFPQSMARMGPATAGLYDAVVERQVTHDGNRTLARHVAHATLRTDARGSRIVKEHRQSARRIDGAVAAVMAHSRALELARRPKPSIYLG